MKNVVIGIHGLGNKPPESLLRQWWMLAMKEGLASNSFTASLPLFEFVYWSDILHDKPLDPEETDVESPYYLDEPYTRAPEDFPLEDYSIRKKLTEFLGHQMKRIFLNDDLSLNYSFITDTILTRYFGDLQVYYSGINPGSNQGERLISRMIRERLYNKLIGHKNDNIMLICHSMGSIIAFDVLTLMAPQVNISTLVTIGSPLGLPVVIGKIASEKRQRGIEDTVLRTPPGVTKNWYNFSDILDKVAFNHTLSEYFSENSRGVKPVDFLVINNFEINGERNPHKSFGYLRTPEFSKILNQFILEEKLTMAEKLARRFRLFWQNAKSMLPAGTKKP